MGAAAQTSVPSAVSQETRAPSGSLCRELAEQRQRFSPDLHTGGQSPGTGATAGCPIPSAQHTVESDAKLCLPPTRAEQGTPGPAGPE